jgi:hypothetical protein
MTRVVRVTNVQRRSEERTSDDATDAEPALKRAEPASTEASPRGRMLGLAAIVVAAASATSSGDAKDETQQTLLAATGALAFAAAAVGVARAERAVVALAITAAAGLALSGWGPSPLGLALLFLGVPGLAGAIHRLGRLGPDSTSRAGDVPRARDARPS